jgi:hypothetical protein
MPILISCLRNTNREAPWRTRVITLMFRICLQPWGKPVSYTNTGLYKITLKCIDQENNNDYVFCRYDSGTLYNDKDYFGLLL